MDVGFIGLGTMGRPMAYHLIRGGHALFLHSRSGVPAALTAVGGIACANGREVAERAEVVFTMVPDTPDVEAVLFGADGVAEGLAPGKAVVDTSSISPIATRLFASRIEALGCDYVDAPVSGGQAGARDAALAIMAGGKAEAVERVWPLLALLGQRITHVGPCGAGQTCKVANQIMVALHLEATAEALLFAAKAGADPVRVREALLDGFAASRVLEVHGERMLARQFEPGFRIELHQRDLQLALATARELHLPLPGTAATEQLFGTCAAHGGARWDHSALLRALEQLAAFELAS